MCSGSSDTEKLPMAGSISEDFRDELTCPICINVYIQPLRLPCGHSYCRSCVVNMVKPTPVREARHPGERQLSCPECRQLYPIPAQGVDVVFRPDFKLARLVEVLDRVEKRASQQTLDTVSSLPDLRATPDLAEEGPVSFYDNVGEEGLPQSLPEHLPPFPLADSGSQTAPGDHGTGHQGNATPSDEERDGTRRKVIVSPRPTPERDTGSDRTVSGDENTGENRVSVSGDARKDTGARSEPPDVLEDEVASPDDWTSNTAYASPQLRRWQSGNRDSTGQVGQGDREGSAPRQGGNAEQTALHHSSRAGTPIRGGNSSVPITVVPSQSPAREQTSQVRIERLLTPDLTLPSDPVISGLSALSSDESTLVPEVSSIVENPNSQRVVGSSAAQGSQAGPGNKAVGQTPVAATEGGARVQTPGNRVERPTTLAVEPRTNPLRTLPPTAPARGSTRELNVQASQTASAAVEPQGATASLPESGAEASSSAEGSSEGSLNPGQGKPPSEPHGSSASPEGSRSQSSRSSKLSFGMKLKKFFSSLLSLDSSDDDDDEDSMAPSSSDSAQPRRKKESSSSMSSYDNDKDQRLSSSSSSDLEETRRKYLLDEDSDSD